MKVDHIMPQSNSPLTDLDQVLQKLDHFSQLPIENLEGIKNNVRAQIATICIEQYVGDKDALRIKLIEVRSSLERLLMEHKISMAATTKLVNQLITKLGTS